MESNNNLVDPEPVIEPENEEKEAEEALNPFKKPTETPDLIIWTVLIPIKALFYISIPDPRREKFGKFPYYFISFIVATAYVGMFTYGVVWMVVIIGKLDSVLLNLK
jgi:hypothetical protein